MLHFIQNVGLLKGWNRRIHNRSLMVTVQGSFIHSFIHSFSVSCEVSRILIPMFFWWEREELFEVYRSFHFYHLGISTFWSLKLSFEGKSVTSSQVRRFLHSCLPSDNFPNCQWPYFTKFWGVFDKLHTGLGLFCYKTVHILLFISVVE
jgi:hypothetical protein